LSQTFQARWAIGSAFQSINGRLTAVISGLALKAISNDTVGSASGKRLETAGNAGFGLPSVAAALRTRRDQLDVVHAGV